MRRRIMWQCFIRMRRKRWTWCLLICSRSSWIHHDLDKRLSISETFLSLFTCHSGRSWVISGHLWSFHYFGLFVDESDQIFLTRICAFLYLQHINLYVTVSNEQYLRASSNQFFVEKFRRNHHKQKVSRLDAFSYVLSDSTIEKMTFRRFCNCVVFLLK